MKITTKSWGSHEWKWLVLGILLVISSVTNFASEKKTAQKSQANPDNESPQQPEWVATAGEAAFSAPELFPAGFLVAVVTPSGLLFGVDSKSGLQRYLPVSLSAPLTAWSSTGDSIDSSTNKEVIYLADQNGEIHALNVRDGHLIWVAHPSGESQLNIYGAAVVLQKKLSSASYTHPTDLLILGTRNPGTRNQNQVLGMSASTGVVLWQLKGNVGIVPPLDMTSSTPLIDYSRNSIWLTSRSADSARQPSLWEIDANAGSVLSTSNLGDVDGSPVLTPRSEVLFVGNNAGTLFAIDPSNGTTLASLEGSDGAVRGAPAIVNSNPPYQVVFSSSSKVQEVSFDARTNTFTRIWNTSIASPSTPLHLVGLSKIYVGSSDGRVHELDAVTGSDRKQRSINLSPTLVGAPVGDASLSRIYVCATDQHIYAFAVPF